MTPRYKALTLAIHPTSKGFGWVAFESPLSIYSFGTVGVKGTRKNAQCLKRIEKLLTRLKPEVVVLEAFEPERSARATRIAKLGRAVIGYAVSERIDVTIYPYKDVQLQFAHLGARSRQDIAEAVARLFPQLAPHLPKRRQAWEGEPWRFSLFCAAAVGSTHYQRSAVGLLDTL